MTENGPVYLPEITPELKEEWYGSMVMDSEGWTQEAVDFAAMLNQHRLAAPIDERLKLERELAEDAARTILESECVHMGDGWLDTSSYDVTDPEGALRYLDLRGMVERDPDIEGAVRLL